MEFPRKIFQWCKANWFLFLFYGWFFCSRYFENYFPTYLFPLTAFWVGLWVIFNFVFIINGIQILKEKSLLEFFKRIFFINAIFIIGFGAVLILTSLVVFLASIVPESISSTFPLILAVGVLLYLIGLGFHFVEKSTNK